MPQFSNVAPKDPRGFTLHLVRCPSGNSLTGIVTSDDLIGCPTHYWHGRTVPHEEVNCPACKDGQEWRWHSWLSAFNPRNHEAFIFESTARVTDLFTAYRDSHGGLRGCKFRAQRRSTAPNARVYLELAPANLQDVQLPDPPDLLRCMCSIWNIPLPNLDVEGILHSIPRVVVKPDGNGKLVTPDGQILPDDYESRRKDTPHARNPRDR